MLVFVSEFGLVYIVSIVLEFIFNLVRERVEQMHSAFIYRYRIRVLHELCFVYVHRSMYHFEWLHKLYRSDRLTDSAQEISEFSTLEYLLALLYGVFLLIKQELV